MKKVLKAGKKPLSLFLAVVMVITAWVFVAPTKADAVNAGEYDVRITWQVTNEGGNSNEHYSGRSNFSTDSDTNNCAGVSLYYKTDNGTGTQHEVWWEIGHQDKNCGKSTGSGATVKKSANYCDDAENKNYYLYATLDGFPTELFIGNDYAAATVCGLALKSLDVKIAGSGTWQTLWSGTAKVESQTAQTYVTINKDGGKTGKGSQTWPLTDHKAEYSQTSNDWGKGYPTPTSVNWTSATTTDLTLSKTDTVSREMRFNILDQYGVVMSTSALNSLSKAAGVEVSGSKAGTLGTNSSQNLYYSFSNTDAAYNSVTVYAKVGAHLTDADVQSITITPKYGSTTANLSDGNSGAKSFNLKDESYTFKYHNTHGGTASPGTDTTAPYYNTFGSVTTSGTRTGFDFIGFFRDADVQDSFDTDNTVGKTKLSSLTRYDGDYDWYAAWRARQYTATFNYKVADGENAKDATTSVTDCYSKTLTAPTSVASYIDGDLKYTFTGWSPAVPATMPDGNITYNAQYSSKKIYADYEKVNKAIDDANKMKADDPDFYNRYTEDSTKTLDDAINAVVEGLGKSQQDVVDGYASSINNAIAALKVKKFTVLFVDEEGKLINKDALKFVNYGEVITVPDTVTKDYDATYHYEFAGWDASGNSDYDPNNKQVTVTDDLTFIAKFNRHMHSYTHEGGTQTIPSDCTTNGVIKYTCTCGYSYTEANEADKAHHRFEEKVIVAATCSAIGYKANVCSKCGAIEKDSKVELDKLDHTWNHTTEDETWDELAPATCYNHGAEKRTCSVCQAIEVRDIEQLNHNWEMVEGADADGWVTTEATCTTPGYKTRKCTNPNCNYVQTVQTEPAKGHKEATRVKEATCASIGCTETYCSVCDAILKVEYTPASGNHKWDTTVAGADENGWVTVATKTCLQKEVKERTCSVCKMKETHISDDFGAHVVADDPRVEPTCTSTGLKAGTHCSYCGKVLTAQEEIPAINHANAGDKDWVVKQNATCTSDGYKVQICPDCKLVIATETIPSHGGHKWDTSVEGADADGWVTTTAATCTTDGEAERTCERDGCGAKETKVLPKLGHDWGEWTQSIAPTCTVPGEEQRVCGNDNTHVETRKVPATGHNYTTEVKQPTCKDAGYTKHTCACGDKYYTDIKNPIGHHFVEDKTAYVEPTNTQPGQKVFYCDNDGCTVRYTVELAPQGHTFAKDEANSQAPKCTEPGWNIFKCTAHENCGITYREELPELGHHFVLDHEKTIPASCLTDGTNAYKCDRDGCTATMTETVKAVGHDMQFVEHIDADCIHYGRDIYKCSKCNYTEERQIDTEKPTGTHDFGVLLVVAPTCTQQGFTVFKCRVCDATFRGDFKAPLGHEWDEGHHIDPTCTEPGGTLYTCTRTETYVDENGKTQTKQCGATKLEDEEPALGHDMGQWYFAPDGDHYVNKRDCNREGCPYSEYEEINGEKVVYYKVDFVSYKYVGEYYTAGDGTKLAYSMDEQPNAYKEVVVDTQYIKSGEPCKYAGEKLELPKTKAFGVYNLTGWKLDKGDLSSVTTNITAKAQFQGEDIYYEVNFYSYDGHLVKGPVHVLHGQKVALDDRPLDEYVTRPTNNQYKYEFTGKWDKDIEAIYSTGPIHAVFKQIPLTYKVVFHDWDGKVVATQILGYGEGVNDATKAAFSTMKRDEDDAYIYEWTPASRRWVDAKGNIVDENHVKVPDNQGYQEYTPEKEKDEFLSDREKGIFHVYASYPQKVKYYRFNVSAKYADGSIAEGATVTVQSPDGQLVYTTKLNEKGTATVTVEHYEYVTVNITGGGETNSLEIGLGKDNIVDGYFGNEGDEIPSFAFELSNYVDPDPDHGGSTKCKCICHTFLGGLWINFLNILYRLFGKKTVCCHDMYEKHGDRLAYGK